MMPKIPRFFPSERFHLSSYRTLFLRVFYSCVATLDSLPKHLQSGFSVLGSLVVLIVILGLVGHQAEIHETVIRQTRQEPKVSDWPIHCPVPLTTDLPNKTRVHLSPQSFQLRIKVLAYNRLESLTRCLNALANAHYDGDVVRLHILLDHFIPTENSTKVEERLANARHMLNFVDGFNWPYGPKDVHYRTSNAGLQAQWLEAWWPSSESEFALILEDDVQVSPHFYRFLRTSINKYYFDVANSDPSLFAISLQRPKLVPGVFGNPLRLENTTNLFLYQMVGSFGLMLFPKPWKEFRMWYDAKKSTDFKPILEGLITTHWYKMYGEKLWLPWIYYFVHVKKYLSLFYNLPAEQSLAVSHRDPGGRFTVGLGPESDLFTDISLIDENFLNFPSVNKLPRYDLCFEEFLPSNIARATEEIEALISRIHINHTVILVNAIEFSEAMIKNWICHANNIPLVNYCIISDNNQVAFELSRRGIPVILVHNLDLKDVDLDPSAKKLNWGRRKKFGKIRENMDLNFQKWKSEHTWVDTIAYVLQLGYNVVSTRIDLLWKTDVSQIVDFSAFDVTLSIIPSQRSSFDLFALKCSKNSQRLWMTFMNLFLEMVKKEIDGGSMSSDSQADSTEQNRNSNSDENFIVNDNSIDSVELMKSKKYKKQELEKLFLQSMENSNAVVQELDTKSFCNLDQVFYKNCNDGSGNDTTSAISLNLHDLGTYYELLKESSLWILDEDLACKEIVCKRSTML